METHFMKKDHKPYTAVTDYLSQLLHLPCQVIHLIDHLVELPQRYSIVCIGFGGGM